MEVFWPVCRLDHRVIRWRLRRQPRRCFCSRSWQSLKEKCRSDRSWHRTAQWRMTRHNYLLTEILWKTQKTTISSVKNVKCLTLNYNSAIYCGFLHLVSKKKTYLCIFWEGAWTSKIRTSKVQNIEGSEHRRFRTSKVFLGWSECWKSKRSQHRKIRTSKLTYHGVWSS